MRKMLKKFILPILLSCASPLFAQWQIPDFQFEHVSLEQGVANTLVWCIYQDRKGFLWYGTMYGLVKYNGYEYTTYRHDPADTSSLANDDILSICEDRNNFLWIGTYGGGVNRLDRSTGKFTRYLHNRRQSIADQRAGGRDQQCYFATDNFRTAPALVGTRSA